MMPTDRVSLSQPIDSRNGTFTKDSRSANCVFETNGEKRDFVKRAGLIKVAQLAAVTAPAELASQGLVEYDGKIISVIETAGGLSSTLRSTDPTTYVTTDFSPLLSDSTSQAYFAKTFNDALLLIQNRVSAYLLDKAGTLTQLSGSAVVSVSVVAGGTRYSQGTTLTFSGGTSLAGYPVITAGVITSVVLTNGGDGFLTPPTVFINFPATVTTASTGTAGLNVINVASSAGIFLGMYALGSGVDGDAYVTNIVGNAVQMSVVNTGAVSGNVDFYDRGNSTASLVAVLASTPEGPFVAGAVFLDNYLFLGTDADAPLPNRIYNCKLGDPTIWGALDYISFEQTSDQLVAICRHLNYLVAFGSRSTQFFYDAGTSVFNTGSPLAVAQSYTSEIGCASAPSVVAVDNTIFWIGESKLHGRSVYLMDGVSPVRVSTFAITKHLEADSLAQVNAFCHKYNGHILYILTLRETKVTLVFDATEKMWYQWTQWSKAASDEPSPGTFHEAYFRPTFYAEVAGKPYCLTDRTAELLYFDTNTYTDDGQHIYCRTVTDKIDNGSTNNKFYGRLEIVADKVPGGVMQIRHTGDDYNTWSPYRSVDLNAVRAQIYLNGSDRRRAWEFLCTSDVPLRLDAAEMDFRIGGMDQEQGVGGGGYRK